MKRKISVLAVILLAMGITACGNNEEQTATDATQTIQTESSKEAETANNSEKEADQAVINESASDTNDAVAEEASSEETGSTNENGREKESATACGIHHGCNNPGICDQYDIRQYEWLDVNGINK